MEDVSVGIEETETPLVADEAIPKDRVTDLIKREKEAAYRKAQREFQAQLDAAKSGQTQGMGGMQPTNIDDVYTEVTKRLQAEIANAQEQSQQAEYESFVKAQVESYLKKMSGATGIADDFQEMTSKFKPDKFKEVFYLANAFENTPEIIYELSSNPYKLANIDYLAKTDPDLAKDQLAAIARSIEANNKAKASNVSAQPPLSRPKPSLVAGADSGAMGLKDLKGAPWLRG